MLLTLTVAEELFDKIITDFDIHTHNFHESTWKRWMMEAMQHIGGLHKFPMCFEWQRLIVNNGGTIKLAITTVNVTDVKYHKDEKCEDITKFSDALYSKTGLLDTTEERAYFTFVNYATTPSVKTSLLAPAIKINKHSGAVFVKLLSLPFYTKDSTVYIPTLPTYQEAIMWYIIYKMQNMLFFKNPQKGPQLQQAQGMWQQLRTAAYGEVMMPDKWELEELGDTLSLGISYTSIRSSKDRHNPGDGNFVGTKDSDIVSAFKFPAPWQHK